MKLKSNSANRIVAMLLFLFCFQFTQSQIQCRYWHTGDEYTDWGSVSPTHSPLPGNAPHASYATSTAYWTNGTSSTIDFTISDNNIHLYNPVDGPLDIPFFDMTNTVPGSEIVAIPKPGSECRHYYIIYPYNRVNISSHPSQQTGLSYVEFDSEYYNATVGSENNLVNYSVYQNTNSSVFTPAIAVTKMAADKSRFLYAVTAYTVGVGNPVTTRIYKYNITSSGITEVDMTPTLANNYIEINARIAPTELELSHNQQTLAFARTNNTDFNNIDLVTISLDASGNLLNGSLSNVKTYNLTDVIVPGGSGDNYTGIEFHPNNQTLYINNANDGIRSFAYTQTSPTPQISSTKITSSFDYSKSELELRYCTNCANPQICAVSNGSTNVISYINTTSNSMTSTGVSYTYSANTYYPQINNVYTLPDQVDGEDYTTWSNPLNSTTCCTRYYVPQVDYPVTTTQTWSPGAGNNPFGSAGEIYFKGTLTINPNVTLTIQNMTVRFHPDAKLVISAANGQPNGARLNLVNTTLNGLNCSQTWEGVRILGNPTQAHLNTYQGLMNMGTNSRIENARIAVAMWDGSNYNTSGGIAQVANSTFLNNRRDVEVVKYPSTGTFQTYTFFDLCNFTINNSYLFPTIDHRAVVAQYRDLRFKGCTFANDNTSFQSSALNNMIGVWGFDASFSVAQSTITPSVRSVFRKLFNGVRATRFFANEPYVVQRTDFNQNQMGVLSEGANNFVVNLQNTFNVGNNSNFTSNTGLFINQGSGFNVRDNIFTGITGVTSFGSVVRNTNLSVDADNTIYRNTFTNLNIANQPEGYNRRSGDQAGGLYYFCNTQSQNGYDIRVLPDYAYTNPWQGIKALQGLNISGQLRSAQNTFSHTSQPLNSDLYNDPNSLVQNLVYYWDGANPAPTTPTYNSAPPKVTLVQGVTKNCASGNPYQLNIAEFNSYGFEATSYEQAKADYLNTKYIYNLLIDDGNKEAIKQEIDYEWSSDAWELRNNLLAKSPNLSEEVLTHAAQKNILPPALLFEVCLANIRSSRRATFIEKLETTFTTSLPSYMIDILKNYQEPETYRKAIEEQYATASAQLSGTYQELLTYLLIDTNDRSELTIQLLEDVPLNTAKLTLIETYAAKGRTSDAQTLINTLRNQNPDDLPLNQDLDVSEFALSKSGNYSNLSETDLTFLQQIASEPTHAGYVRANNLLRFVGLSQYNVLPLDIIPSSFKKDQPIAQTQQQTNDAELKLYPNPAKDYLTIDYTVYTSASNLVIEILDNTGKIVASTTATLNKNHRGITNISIADLPAGSYFVAAKDGSKTVSTSTFSKSK